MTEQRKAVIKNADMSEDMQQDAVDCASQALSKYNIEKVRQSGKAQRSVFIFFQSTITNIFLRSHFLMFDFEILSTDPFHRI